MTDINETASPTEGDDEEHGSVGDLMELYEVLEWNKAVKEADGKSDG